VRQRTLQGRRVTLERLTGMYAFEHYKLVNDPRILKYTTLPQPYKIEDSKRFIAGAMRKKTEFVWGIFVEGILIGVISLKNINCIYKSAELGFLLGTPYWSKGYMTESVGVVLNFATEYNFNIYLKIIKRNHRSIRLAKRLGIRELYDEKITFKGKSFIQTVFIYDRCA